MRPPTLRIQFTCVYTGGWRYSKVLASIPPFELAWSSLKDSSVLCVLLARTEAGSSIAIAGTGGRTFVTSSCARGWLGLSFAPSVPPRGPPCASLSRWGSSVICLACPRHDEAVRGFGSDVALNSLRLVHFYVHHRNSGSVAIVIASARSSGFFRSNNCWLIEGRSPVKNRCNKMVEVVLSLG